MKYAALSVVFLNSRIQIVLLELSFQRSQFYIINSKLENWDSINLFIRSLRRGLERDPRKNIRISLASTRGGAEA